MSEARAAIVPRYRIGDHVRVLGTGYCGTVRSILHFPRAIAYGVAYDDHQPPHLTGADAGAYSEHELRSER